MENSPSLRNDTNGAKIAARRASKKNDRRWTAVERYKLRGLIEREMPASAIARSLKRPLASITAMAATLGLTLNDD